MSLLFDERKEDAPELSRDDGHVTNGVDVTLNVNDIGVVEGTCSRLGVSGTVAKNEGGKERKKRRTDDLEDTVNGTDVGQEVVSETSTGGSALGKTSNVDTGEESGDLARGLVEVAKPVEALCRDRIVSVVWWKRGIWRAPSGTETRASSGSMVALQGGKG